MQILALKAFFFFFCYSLIICNLTASHFLSNLQQARCSEDLLRNKIKALEAQLQLCLQVRHKIAAD